MVISLYLRHHSFEQFSLLFGGSSDLLVKGNLPDDNACGKRKASDYFTALGAFQHHLSFLSSPASKDINHRVLPGLVDLAAVALV